MLKKHTKSIVAGTLAALVSIYGGMIYADATSQPNPSEPKQVATITPATITPSTVTPATVTPTTITPPVVTPPVITPATINPSTTTPSTTTPSITTPTTITPAQVNPGNSSSASSTSVPNPNAKPTATDVSSKPIKKSLPVGVIVKIHGTVDVLKKNKRVFSLKEQSLFFKHDIIFTKNDSTVAMRFNDGTFVVLGPDSALEIKEYHFTIPAKGKPYEGSTKDRAEIKLYKGILKARLGSLATANTPNAFSILTPRGRVQLSDAKKNPNIDLVYNNKVGLVVKALGTINNSKGQVTISDKSYGLVSAVVGSAPTTTGSLPYALTETVIVSTTAFFNSQVSQVNTSYSESIMTLEEESMMQSETSSETPSNDSVNLEDESGDDDGSDEDDTDEDDDSDDNDDSGDDDSGDDDSDDSDDSSDDDGGDDNSGDE